MDPHTMSAAIEALGSRSPLPLARVIRETRPGWTVVAVGGNMTQPHIDIRRPDGAQLFVLLESSGWHYYHPTMTGRLEHVATLVSVLDRFEALGID